MNRFPNEPPQPQLPAPFNRRWEDLRSIIERLYIDKNHDLSDLIEIMKEQHNFDANESQYKYRFKKWGLRKNVPSSKKDMMLEMAKARAQSGKSSMFTYKHQNVNTRKLVRQARKAAMTGLVLQRPMASSQLPASQIHGASIFSDRIFLQWSMPFGVFNRQQSESPRYRNQPSPLMMVAGTPPSEVSLHTPPTAQSPADAHSPLSAALKRVTTMERAHLFVQGKHQELLRSLNRKEKRVMSTWLHQFWLYSFTTATYWGRGPRVWTADNLGFDGINNMFDVTSSGDMNSPRSISQYSSPRIPTAVESPKAESSHRSKGAHPQPSQLCRWSIHVFQHDYDAIPDLEQIQEADDQQRAIDEEWPTGWETPSLEERMRDNLETNDFSNIAANDLPIAMTDLAKAAKSSGSELLEEALGFAIMGRNLDLVADLTTKIRSRGLDISGLYPHHLAASYLDGSQSCCQIFQFLNEQFYGPQYARNKLGHTSLDALMMTILKSHTAIAPAIVDDSLRDDMRFPGDEVDICGRWDATSRHYRDHLSTGSPRVPFSWKHKFCHTSIQAVTHCISALLPSVLHEPSGLSLKWCGHCGMKLQLLPLHALVLTAFHLGNSGCPGEDLFGVVACLFAMLDSGLDVSATAEVSLQALFATDNEDNCNHEELSPVQFALQIPTYLLEDWPAERQLGWRLFCHVLQLVDSSNCNHQNGCGFDRLEGEYMDDATEAGFRLSCDFHWDRDVDTITFGHDRQLGHLWAGIQTELLSYRRLQEGDPWLSEKLNIEQILFELEHGEILSTPLVRDGMMKKYCPCGRFEGRHPDFPLRRDCAAAFYFSNLDDWSRTRVLDDRFLQETWEDI